MNAAILCMLALAAPMMPPRDDAAPPLVASEPEASEPAEPEPTETPSEPETAEPEASDDEPPPPLEREPQPREATSPEKPAAAPPVVRAAPPPDRPIRWRFDLGVGGGTTFVPDPAFFAFTPASRQLPGFALQLRGDVRLAQGRFFLGGGLGYRRSARAGWIYDTALDLEVVTHDPHALMRASFMAVEGVDIYAQGAVGPSIVLMYAS